MIRRSIPHANETVGKISASSETYGVAAVARHRDTQVALEHAIVRRL